MSPYIFLILLLPVLQGCLVVRTPGCECPVLALRFSNIDQNIGSHVFYQNVSGYPMVTPVVRTEECAVSMYCEGDYSLVVFDKEMATMLGAYSADGVCDPRTQKWQVDTGSGEGLISFDRLFGICVNYAPTCACPMHIISSDAYAEQLLSPHVDWTDRLKLYHYSVLPTFNSETECPTNFECPERHSPIAVTSNRRFPNGVSRLTCNKDCEKYNPCGYLATDNPETWKNNQFYQTNASKYYTGTPKASTTDKCETFFQCDPNYTTIMQENPSQLREAPSSIQARCINTHWLVDLQYTYRQLNLFCVDYTRPKPT